MPQRLLLDRLALLQAVRQAAVFAAASGHALRLEIERGAGAGPGRVTVASQAGEIGGHRCELSAEVDGEDLRIGFNIRYLLAALAAIDTPQVGIELQGRAKPGVIRPVGDESLLLVVMPLSLPDR